MTRSLAKNTVTLQFAADFGAFLVNRQVIEHSALKRAVNAARQGEEHFHLVLTKLGLVSEDDLYRHLAAFLSIPVFTPAETPPQPILIERTSFLRNAGIIPLKEQSGILTVAVVDPFDKEACDALAYATGLTIERRLAPPSLFEKTWRSLYADADSRPLEHDERATHASDTDLQRLRDIANEAPVVRQVTQIITGAVEAHASDIHIEPTPDGVQVRYRVDGDLHVAIMLPTGLKEAIASRIKIMSRLDIAERRLPQDGRIKLAIRGVDIDFRISTLPTVHGESIVLRILDRSAIDLDFEALGFEPDTIATLRDAMNLPNGIVLVTGPTGSGKTTTLYTALRELAQPKVKIFTVEDPVEYQLEGISQVQIEPTIGLDFPRALRAMLRQNPNIIMIGEIRDAETARIAIQASLTGHLVFSTLHTNSAASSITRLIDMGVESYLIASTVKAVLAQRLVRRLCPACASPLPSANQWRDKISQQIQANGPDRLLQPTGCPQCRGIGYSGRATIAELLVVDDHIRQLIAENVSDAGIERAACASGMKTLYQCGMAKAWRGETSIAEVFGVTRTGSSQ